MGYPFDRYRRGRATTPYGGPAESRRPAAAMETGLSHLTVAIDALQALEERLRLVEDELTDGQALDLPETPRALASSAGAERRLAESAALVGAMTRRINLRLGGIERALGGRAPLDRDEEIRLRSEKFAASIPGVRSRYGLD